MKKIILVLLSGICLSLSAGAVEIPATNGDRIDLGSGVIGITNTEKFEYVCEMTQKTATETVNFKTYLDVNFGQENNYRFAVGFVGGGSVMGMIAAEADIVKVTKARCPGLCLMLTIKSSEDNSLSEITFQEVQITKAIQVTTTENNKTESIGTCKKNEVN